MKTLFTLFLLLLASNLEAQNFIPLPNYNPFSSLSQSASDYADVDGDGDLDLLLLGSNESFTAVAKLYINQGDGGFSELFETPFEGLTEGSVNFADVDQDGDPDVMMSGLSNNNEAQSRLYLNDGSANFTENQTVALQPLSNGANTFVDLDLDGDLDLLMTGMSMNEEASAQLYLNNGMGDFEAVASNVLPVMDSALAFADIDDDGDHDLFLTGWSNEEESVTQLYLNDGTGNLTLDEDNFFEGVSRGSLALADIDSDGDLDFYNTGQKGLGNAIARLYINDGNGQFAQVPTSVFVPVKDGAVAFSDLDGDGDPELLVSGANNDNSPFTGIFFNDGSGYPSSNWQSNIWGSFDCSMEIFDFDNDGDADCFLSGDSLPFSKQSVMFLNDGSGDFFWRDWPSKGWAYSAVATIDHDDDQDDDIIITGWQDSQLNSRFYYQHENANMYMSGSTIFPATLYGTIDHFQEDDQDYLLFTGWNSAVRIAELYKESVVWYSEVTVPFEGVDGSCAAVADTDGDGDMDIFIAGATGSNLSATLYENLGADQYSAKEGTPFAGVSEGWAEFADVDSDGDADLFLMGEILSGTRIARLYLNNGSGNFDVAVGNTFTGLSMGACAFSDIDSDDDLDLITTGLDNLGNPKTVLYINDGPGNFIEHSDSILDNLGEGALTFGDVDNDGDEDLILTGKNEEGLARSVIYHNDGSGKFVESDVSLKGVSNGAVTFLDFANDNDEDLFISGLDNNGRSISQLYVNEGDFGPSTLSEEQEYLAFSLHPNPVSKDYLEINFAKLSSPQTIISVYASNGQLLVRESSTGSQKKHKLDIGYLAAGTYFLHLSNEEGSGGKAFVVK